LVALHKYCLATTPTNLESPGNDWQGGVLSIILMGFELLH
jgi:hypothetical protein